MNTLSLTKPVRRDNFNAYRKPNNDFYQNFRQNKTRSNNESNFLESNSPLKNRKFYKNNYSNNKSTNYFKQKRKNIKVNFNC